METDRARIERLMTLATGDEKHDSSSHSTLDVLWVLYDRILYCTAPRTVAPFDGETLRATSESSNIVIVEPYYEGALVPDVCAAMKQIPIRVEAIGVPHKVLTHYGNPEEHDEELGLTPKGIRHRIERFLND